MKLIPPIGAKGIFKLLEPFQNSLLTNVIYTCNSVRRMADIVAAGGDPEAMYYTPNGLSRDVFKKDSADGVCIVSLQAGSGSWVYVPSSYIASFPDTGGIPYTTLVLAISLAAIPEYMDLSYIKTKIASDVKENLGVDSTVNSIAVSPTTLISEEDHKALEAARQFKITNSTTDYARLLKVTAERDSLLQKVKELETYIKTKLPH